MADREDVKRFITKINPFAEKVPDITEKISKLTDDEDFQNLLERLGTIGGLFSVGLYLFDKTLDLHENNEKTYYSLMNRTAISVAEQIIKQEYDVGLIVDKETSEKILVQMMKIYSFKETNKRQYEKWNGKVSYGHPIIQDFKKK